MNPGTCQEKQDIINYAKYVADPIKNYQFTALLLGIDPEKISYFCDPTQFEWLGDCASATIKHYTDNPWEQDIYKPLKDEFYHILSTLNKRFKGENDANHLLESCFENRYPKIDQTKHIDLLDAIKPRFLNMIRSQKINPEHYKHLIAMWQPEHTDAKIYGINFCDYPESIQVALKIFAEHWHNLPNDMCTPTKKYIEEQIHKNATTKLTAVHIYKVSKPDIQDRRSEKYDEYLPKAQRSGY